MSTLILFAPTILFCLILLWQVLSGLRRGLRKSVILLINMVLAIICSIITFNIIFGGNFDTRIVGTADTVMGWFGGSLQDMFKTPEPYDKLSEYFHYLLINNLEDFTLGGDDLLTALSIIVAMAQSLVKVVGMFFIGFFYAIFKFIFYIVYLIFFKEGRRKKRCNDAFARQETTKPYKKRKGFGALVGLGRGLIVGIFAFSFIGSFFYIFTDGKYSKENETFVTDDQYYINEIANMVNRYGTVGIGSILESIKNPDDIPIYLLIADSLTVGNYETAGENPKEGSFYLRRELGPIVSMVKEAYLVALQYDADMDRMSDSQYFLELLKVEKDGVTYADRVDSIIDKYNFGECTLILSQSLLNAVANSVDFETENGGFGQKIMYYALKGPHSIKAEELINNDSINSLLKFALCVAKNMDELEDFGNRFSSSNEETLAFGVKKLSAGANKDYSGVTETIDALDDVLESLDAVKDGLITDIVLEVFRSNFTEFSLKGVEKEDDKFSAYNIKWKENLASILGLMRDTVKYIVDNNIYTADELIDGILASLSEENSVGSSFIDTFAKSDISGIFLNADGFKDYINDMLSSSEVSISLPTDIIYGNYYDENGTLVQGELCTLIINSKDKVKVIYDVINDSKTNEDMINGLLSDENGLVDLIVNYVDVDSKQYSRFIHSVFSSVLTSVDEKNYEIKIEDSMYDDNGYILSKELMNAISTIKVFVPFLTQDEINYDDLLTEDNIEKIRNCRLLFGSGSVIIYKALSGVNDISKYIPQSYSLATEAEIDANLSKWTANNGELDTLLDAVVKCDLVNLLLNNNENINYADVIFNDVVDFAINLGNAINSSVLLNCILTGFITEMDFGDFALKIPQSARLEDVDGLKRINGSQISSLIEICRDTVFGLDVIIRNALEDPTYEIDTNALIGKVMDASKEKVVSLFDNRILNATVTNFLLNTLNDSTAISIKIPNAALDSEGEYKMLKSTEISALVDALDILDITIGTNTEIDVDSILSKAIDNAIGIGNAVSNSYIIRYTLTKELEEYASEPGSQIRFASTAKENINGEIYITQEEVMSLTAAISSLRIESLDGIDIESFISNPNLGESVVSSKILSLTLSDKLLSTSGIVVPYAARCYISESELAINTDEINNLISAIQAIGMTQFNGISVDDLLSKSNIASNINSSMILRATIYDKLSTLSVINIPNIAKEKLTSDVFEEDNTVLKETEINGLIEIINGLAITSFDSLDAAQILSKLTNATLITKSDIIRFTITNKMLDASCPLDVPSTALVTEDGQNLLSKSELQNLVSAIKVFNVDDFTNFDAASIFNEQTDSTSLAAAINSSDVIKYTVTSSLTEAGGAFNIPKNALEAKDGYEFITDSEIEGFVGAISGLTGLAFDSCDVNALLQIDGISSKVNSSLILRYTVTNTIRENESLILISSGFETLTAYDNTVETFITEDELTNMVAVLSSLGNLNGLNVDLSIVASSIDTILDSNILHATISDAMFKGGCKLNEPDLENRSMVFEDKLLDDSTYYVMSKSEIKAYFEVAHSLGLNSYDETVPLDGLTVLEVASKIADMKKSQIIICTYSANVIKWYDDNVHTPCPTITVENVYSSPTLAPAASMSIVDKSAFA